MMPPTPLLSGLALINTATPTIAADAESSVCILSFLLVTWVVTRFDWVVTFSFDIGAPHFGQAGALSDISDRHSGQLISDICDSPFLIKQLIQGAVYCKSKLLVLFCAVVCLN